MLKYFISVVQEMSEAAVVLAAVFIISTCLNFMNERRWMLRALAVALLLALIVAYLKQTTRNVINQEWLNFYTITITLVFGLAYLVRLYLHEFTNIKRKDDTLNGAISFVLVLGVSFFPLPNYLLHPTDFVLADQSVFSNDFLFRAVGYLAGTLLVFLTSVSFYHVAMRLNFRTIVYFATAVTVIALCGMAGTLIQFLVARRFMPITDFTFSLVKFAVNYSDVFVYAILIVILVPGVSVFMRNLREHGEYRNPAEHRKLIASAMHSRRWSGFLAALFVIAIIDLTVVQDYANRGFELSPIENHETHDGKVIIPIEQVNDGHLHRFAHTTEGGTQIRFIIIKKQGVAFGVGFDACEICGATGYYERNGQVICMLCDVVMNINTIGYKGGCNPIPLAYSIEKGELVIQIADIEAEEKRFQ